MFSSWIELIHSPPDLITSLRAVGDLHVAVGIDGGDVAGGEPAFGVERARPRLP